MSVKAGRIVLLVCAILFIVGSILTLALGVDVSVTPFTAVAAVLGLVGFLATLAASGSYQEVHITGGTLTIASVSGRRQEFAIDSIDDVIETNLSLLGSHGRAIPAKRYLLTRDDQIVGCFTPPGYLWEQRLKDAGLDVFVDEEARYPGAMNRQYPGSVSLYERAFRPTIWVLMIGAVLAAIWAWSRFW